MTVRIIVEHPIVRLGLRTVCVKAGAAVVDDASPRQAGEIVLLVCEQITSEILTSVRRHAEVEAKVLVMCQDQRPDKLVSLVRAGVMGVLCAKDPVKKVADAVGLLDNGSVYYDDQLVLHMARALQGHVVKNLLPLSFREAEIARLVGEGYKNKEIAERLFISEQTVKNHLHHIYQKLRITKRVQLASYVHEHPDWFSSVAA